MGKERVIFSNRFDRPTLEQIEEEMKKENYDDNENLMSAEEFLDFMKKNRRTIPNERRIANKDKFIWAVRELSETYEIDADLIEDDDGYTASLYMNYASYNGYIKKLLGLIFILSDDFSMFKANVRKVSKTELAATLTYGDQNDKDNNIYYRILKTTFYEGGPEEITGLHTEALGVLFPVDSMDSCEEMMIQDWPGALYKKDDTAFLCWTYSPEVTYVLEYTPSKIDDSEIIKMAESAEPVK